MPARRMISTAAVSICLLSLSGCGASAPPSVSVPASATPPAATAGAAASKAPEPSVSATPEATPMVQAETLTETFDYGNFANSTTIDNPWFPTAPGTQWVLEGSATVDGERIKRRVVTTTTDLTKVIDGVRTLISYELDYNSGELIEAELVFLAQDDDGTVWLIGEYPEEYEDGTFVEAPAWLAGQEDAKAGIKMQVEPRTGTLSYSQGWGPKVDWTDRGRVFETGSETCVPAGCYEGVLVIDEFNRDSPDAHQLKYYARGVGNVRVGWAGAKEEEQEVLQLVKIVHLAPADLAKVRATALALEKHAYMASKDLYGKTEPAQQQ
jgi:hypothetical protein